MGALAAMSVPGMPGPDDAARVAKKTRSFDDLPPVHGTAPIPEGHIRLYHQTNPENLDAIGREGILLSRAKGIEGPRAIYAGEDGFYGKVDDIPTVEFSVPAGQYRKPFVQSDRVAPESIVAIHRPWHRMARYLETEGLEQTLAGEFDDMLADEQIHGPAIRYLKEKYARSGTYPPPR
jgi:hypothetical protein